MDKRILLTLMTVVIILFTSSSVYAQEKGEMGVGAGVSVGTGDDYTNVGIGAKFQWNPVNNLRLEPSFNYFFKKDHYSMWDLNANVHYLFAVTDKITLYPLAGLGVQNIKFNSGGLDDIHIGDWTLSFQDDSKNFFAFNVGAGADFMLTDNWLLNFEFKYKISDYNRAVFSLGLVISFKINKTFVLISESGDELQCC